MPLARQRSRSPSSAEAVIATIGTRTPAGSLLADRAGGRVAVHPRHPAVHEDRGVPVALGQGLHGLDAVDGDVGGESRALEQPDGHHLVDLVVLDDQHPVGGGRGGDRASGHERLVAGVAGRRAEDGGEPEGAASADLALELDVAAEGVDELPDDGQPEAGATVAAGGGRVGLGERVEEPALRGGRDARAGVLHDDLDDVLVGPSLGEVDGDVDRAAVGELHRVRPEVGQDLLPAHGVATDVRRDPGRHGEPEVQALPAGLGPEQPDRPLDDRAHLEVDQLELELAGLDLGQVEDVVDDAAQASSRRRAGPRPGAAAGGPGRSASAGR